MTDSKHRRVTLAARPRGAPRISDFAIIDAAVPLAGSGELLLRTIYLSLDPYMHGRMNAVKSYVPCVEIGETMVGGAVSEVLSSNVEGFAAGDLVVGYTGWQTHAIDDGKGLRKLDPAAAPISTALGILGMPGHTAYVGLLDMGRPRAGETVLVSAASGAVGSAGKVRWRGSVHTASSSTGALCTSKGRHRWAAPGRPVVIARNAARNSCGICSARSMTAFHLVSGRKSAPWSSSVSAKRPRAPTPMSVVMARTAMELSLASTTPGKM